jgi:hypothetical protein
MKKKIKQLTNYPVITRTPRYLPDYSNLLPARPERTLLNQNNKNFIKTNYRISETLFSSAN